MHIDLGTVSQSVAVSVCHQRIRAQINFSSIVQSVIVRVRVGRVGAADKFTEVGQTVGIWVPIVILGEVSKILQLPHVREVVPIRVGKVHLFQSDPVQDRIVVTEDRRSDPVAGEHHVEGIVRRNEPDRHHGTAGIAPALLRHIGTELIDPQDSLHFDIETAARSLFGEEQLKLVGFACSQASQIDVHCVGRAGIADGLQNELQIVIVGGIAVSRGVPIGNLIRRGHRDACGGVLCEINLLNRAGSGSWSAHIEGIRESAREVESLAGIAPGEKAHHGTQRRINGGGIWIGALRHFSRVIVAIRVGVRVFRIRQVKIDFGPIVESIQIGVCRPGIGGMKIDLHPISQVVIVRISILRIGRQVVFRQVRQPVIIKIACSGFSQISKNRALPIVIQTIPIQIGPGRNGFKGESVQDGITVGISRRGDV